jgi:tetrahydromethanopterin S-methyltransferase subunit G
MNTVSGIFNSRAAAERAIELLGLIGTADDRIVLLSPGIEDERVEEVVKETEIGKSDTAEKVGTALGRGIGITGGIMLGGAVGSVFVPGVGVVLAAGVLAAALLGTGGAALGAAAGSAVDEKAAENLRSDQLHLYEAALRQGRSVLVALANDEREAQAMLKVLEDAGAETLEDARETWWSELRSAEEAAYKKDGRAFALDETLYRRGFEAALHPRLRGKTLAESAVSLDRYFSDDQKTEAFQRGYERGQAYYQHVLESFPPPQNASGANARTMDRLDEK